MRVQLCKKGSLPTTHKHAKRKSFWTSKGIPDIIFGATYQILFACLSQTKWNMMRSARPLAGLCSMSMSPLCGAKRHRVPWVMISPLVQYKNITTRHQAKLRLVASSCASHHILLVLVKQRADPEQFYPRGARISVIDPFTLSGIRLKVGVISRIKLLGSQSTGVRRVRRCCLYILAY